jgi:RNA 2',3'-cyclic 3'-phosphodiesterase
MAKRTKHSGSPEQLSFAGFGAPRDAAYPVFFAIRPDAETALRIWLFAEALCRQYGLMGKLLARELLHVTLHYLGNGLSQSKIDEACTAAASVVAPTFDITFDRVANFGGGRGDRSVVLFGIDGVAALKEFRRTLGRGLLKAGIKPQSEKGFTPHMTILHDRHGVEEHVIEPLTWTAHEFCLVRSLVGQGKHQIVARWPLNA